MDMKTQISSVTVFRDGARVTRSGSITLEKGPHKVLISGITEYAAEDSFRVKGKGPASLASIDVTRMSQVFKPSEEVEKLVKKRKKLENEIQALVDEVAIYRHKLENLYTSFQGFSDHFGMVYAAAEGDVKTLREFSTSSEKQTFEANKKIMKLEERQEELQNELYVIQDEINKINAGHRTEYYFDVEVSVEVTEKSKISLDVVYQTSGAGWNPTYDVDLLDQKTKVRRIAMIRNRSKEDWEKVNLTVSTATAKPVEAIEPTPFWVYAYDPTLERKKKAGRMRSMAKEEKAAPSPKMAAPGGALPPAPPAEPAPQIIEEFADVSESVSGISVYELPSLMDVPSDGEPHPVTLIEEEFDSKTLHYWYTDGMAEVVAQDVVTNGDTVLMPGKVNVYAEGDYIGATSIDMISPREEFKLGTRVAYNVKAEKKLVEREMEKAGITKGKVRRSYKYKLKISNYAKKEIEIEIYDRIPHSLNPSIEVKHDFERLGLKSFELGVLHWESKILAGGELIHEYEYEVQWEKGIQISPSLP